MLTVILGGTTTVVAFAIQSREGSMKSAVDEYHRLAQPSHCDYGFHVIVTNPTEIQMTKELPSLVRDGITSIKIYMVCFSSNALMNILSLLNSRRMPATS